MLNVQVIGRDKSKNMAGSFTMLVFVLVAIAMMLLSYFVFSNYFGVISCFLAGLMVTIHFMQPPKPIKIVLNDEGVLVNEILYKWQNIQEWGAMEVENSYEIMLIVKNAVNPYITFYIAKIHFQQYSLFTSNLYSRVKYTDGLNTSNLLQNYLRLFGLK
jgi:hypothetical protein